MQDGVLVVGSVESGAVQTINAHVSPFCGAVGTPVDRVIELMRSSIIPRWQPTGAGGALLAGWRLNWRGRCHVMSCPVLCCPE